MAAKPTTAVIIAELNKLLVPALEQATTRACNGAHDDLAARLIAIETQLTLLQEQVKASPQLTPSVKSSSKTESRAVVRHRGAKAAGEDAVVAPVATQTFPKTYLTWMKSMFDDEDFRSAVFGVYRDNDTTRVGQEVDNIIEEYYSNDLVTSKKSDDKKHIAAAALFDKQVVRTNATVKSTIMKMYQDAKTAFQEAASAATSAVADTDAEADATSCND